MFDDEAEWIDSFSRKMVVKVDIPLEEVPHDEDINFWFFGVHDPDGKEIYRKDKTRSNIDQFVKNGKVFFRENIVTSRIPKTYTIWPCGKTGWKSKIVKPVPGFETH